MNRAVCWRRTSGPESIPSRWLSLLACMSLELCGGSVYTFGVYSSVLKDHGYVGLSQTALDWCAFASNFGNYLPVAGMVYNRMGPRFTAIFGAVAAALGFATLWLLVDLRVHAADTGLAVVAAALACFMWGFGAGHLDAVSVATSSWNFPRHRGAILGVVKALYGLGSALITQLYLGFLYPDAKNLILALAVFCGFVPVLLSPLLSRTAERDSVNSEVSVVARWEESRSGAPRAPLEAREEGSHGPVPGPAWEVLQRRNGAWVRSRLRTFLAVMVVMLLTMMVLSLLPLAVPPDRAKAVYYCGAALSTLYILLFTQVSEGTGARRLMVTDSAAAEGDGKPLLAGGDADPSGADGSSDGAADGSPLAARPADMKLGEVVGTVDFWMLFGTFVVGFGCGLVVSTNAAQIVKASGGGSDMVTAIVSVFSVANALSRVAVGAVSDVLDARGVRRSLLLPVASAASFCSMALMVLGCRSLAVQYVAFPLAGLSYGSFWCLSPVLLGDFFGLKYIASNYTAMAMAAMVGSLCFSTVMAARVYEANRAASDDAEHNCTGPLCFQLTFVIMAALAVAATLLSAILHCRRR